MERVVLQKALADAGVASRRASEAIIKAGRVKVNGITISELGARVDAHADVIAVDGHRITIVDQKVYFLLNKPKDVLTTNSDDRGRKTILAIINIPQRVVPIGRLDIGTTGLLLLSNDGELVYELTHPKFEHEKEYEAEVEIPSDWGEGILKKGLDRLQQGVRITTGRTRPAKTRLIKKISTDHYLISITIHEGRKHQVRQMINAIGVSVVSLKRVRMGPIELGDLKEGEYRELTEQEVSALKKKNSH